MILQQLKGRARRGLAWVAILALGFVAGASHASATTLYYVGGHADVGVGYSGTGNSFDMHYHFVNSTKVAFDDPLSTAKTIIAWAAEDGVVIDNEQEPGGAITYVGTPTAEAPGNVAGYLGLAPNEPYWYLPADSSVAAAENKPWLGFGSEELEDYFLDFSDLTWTLTGVSGPGEFAAWKDSGLLWSSATGATSFTAPIGHDHTNWGFSEAGLYSVTVSVSATHRTYGLVEGSGTYTFQVGPLATPTPVPEPSSLALMGIGGAGALVLRLRRKAVTPSAIPE